jgi:hypothetical protein
MDDRRIDAMGDTAARAASSMQSRLNRVSERAQDLASDAGGQLSRVGGQMGPYMEQAIALTIGLGFVLGKLLGRD